MAEKDKDLDGWSMDKPEEKEIPIEKVEIKEKPIEKAEIKEKPLPKPKTSEPSSPFEGVDKPSKFPLILYIISLAFLVLMGILLGINNGSMDKTLSTDIVAWASNSTVLSMFKTWTTLYSGLLAPLVMIVIGLVFVIIHNNKVTKYGGVFVLLAVIGLGVNRLLMGLFARPAPSTGGSFVPWFTFAAGVSNPWINGSFTSFYMTLAGILFAFPYCFNMKKVFALKIVTGILALCYVTIMGFALVALQMNYLSDVIFAGVLQFWFAAIVGKKILTVRDQELFDIYTRVHFPARSAYQKILKAKSVLDYQDVDYLLKQTKEPLTVENVKAKATAAKGKPMEYQPKIDSVLEILDSTIGKMPAEKDSVIDNVKQMLDTVSAIKAEPKSPKVFTHCEKIFIEVKRILDDNKEYASALLKEAKELYNKSIEAAQNEPGDFTDVINKNKVWLAYTDRFEDGLNKVEATQGDLFDTYMKENFLYII